MSENFMEYISQIDANKATKETTGYTSKLDVRDRSLENTNLIYKPNLKQSSVSLDLEDKEFASQTDIQALKSEIQELKNRMLVLELKSDGSISNTDKRKLLEEIKYNLESTIISLSNGMDTISTYILNAYNISENIWSRLRDQTGYEAQAYVLIIYSLSSYLSGSINPTQEQLKVLFDLANDLQRKKEFNSAMVQFYNQILLDNGLALMDEFI